MAQLHPYLTFNGNCNEAMSFYRECLGGKLMLQRINDAPLSEKMPEKMRQCILQAVLITKTFVLMGTDIVTENGLNKGNSVSLALHCSSEEEIRHYAEKLAAGGHIHQPLAQNDREVLISDITDPFGNHWLLYFDKKQIL
ncbi:MULTISPECIES: VOC family protein [Flavobacterium]|uniref:VOC family protein n=1 Tax=Flavobacterium TaxID=237 RepID=UPI00086A1D32|nr:MULTISPECIES: VOC family protein [Flavobacterium]MBN9283738.1 VOC family protein [Flavobacterium sp.]ODS91164.1 MAG: hypothetical protein ABS44_00680 [Chryseobacterium sp. SCN 40-13]OJV68756.1 MAG: hypothetical protein BGO42_02695 [Flavobacterium sp. 40-81]